ncbi:HTH-type transcriptional activator RhaS [Vibrio aerogenes CECT 7868]|uniref:HTH-type transcriptional activator RhaS n=1 Tax=Vibrio aerogenes CECT 7868 TaxID=1216006 RepID=A0A1M6AMG3_9VIBR|nr:AraC family transcriptional regulator [Vibrio aerogenes]SHI37635.1 HTH-type transcriptional activator RhaS [Vibrio aerogenes CECT 7868]
MENIQYRSTEIEQIRLIEADYQTFAFQRHYHLDIHIGLITQGEQKYFYRGAQHRVGQSQISVILPDEVHDGEAAANQYSVNVFSIHPDWFSQYFPVRPASQQLLSFKQSVIDDPVVFNQLCILHQKLRQKNLSRLARDCLPHDGFSTLLNRYGQLRSTAPVALGNHSLDKIRDFMLSHLDQPVRLQTLADLCHQTPIQLQRQFKAKTGLTPYAWFTRLRLEKALQLIQSGMTGTEVAHQVGFYDQAHFTKAFKRAYGIPPSAVKS